MTWMKSTTVGGLILFNSFTVASAAGGKHGEFGDERIDVNGVERVYRLVVPKSVDLKTASPLVIAFHGIKIDSKDLMPRYTKLNETADKHGFILAYPNAVDQSWGLSPNIRWNHNQIDLV